MKQEIGFRIQIQYPRISLTDLFEKENILSLVSCVSLNMATFDYLSMLNLKSWETKTH